MVDIHFKVVSSWMPHKGCCYKNHLFSNVVNFSIISIKWIQNYGLLYFPWYQMDIFEYKYFSERLLELLQKFNLFLIKIDVQITFRPFITFTLKKNKNC